ncbi:hypothetical protein BH20ACT24_BH20ACT24_18590 [soil metagenome]
MQFLVLLLVYVALGMILWFIIYSAVKAAIRDSNDPDRPRRRFLDVGKRRNLP